jgi:transposase
MKTLSVDLRQRILNSYDEGLGNRQEIADRYRVSLGMVKKLLVQRKRTGDIAARHRFSGRKPLFNRDHRRQLRGLIDQRPDITLEEMREALALRCTLPAIYYVLREMKLTYKKNAARQRARARRRQGGA